MNEDSSPRKHGQLTEQNKDKLLEQLSRTGNLSASAASVGVTRFAVYKAIERDQDFGERIALAREKACNVLENEMYRRGVEGYDEPIFYQGEEVGSVRRYSDKLLQLLARANMGDRYSEKQNVTIDTNVTVEHSAKGKLARLLGIDDIKTIEGTIVEDEEQ